MEHTKEELTRYWDVILHSDKYMFKDTIDVLEFCISRGIDHRDLEIIAEVMKKEGK